MENKTTDRIESLFENIGEYAETRTTLFKMKTVDKSSDLISTILSKLVVYLVFSFFFLLLNIGISLFLGELLGKYYYGFFVMTGFYLIVGLVFYSKRKEWFKAPIADKIIQDFFK